MVRGRQARAAASHLVLTGAQVLRVDLEGMRAKGVTYRVGGVERQAAARDSIVLTAGGIQTPHLLELSGIGDPAVLAVLAAAGLPLRHDLPGVGANYSDHFCTRMNWRVTLNETMRGWRLAAAIVQYFLTRKGILTLGTGLAHGFVRTRPEIDGPDIQYFFMHASFANAAERGLRG